MSDVCKNVTEISIQGAEGLALLQVLDTWTHNASVRLEKG